MENMNKHIILIGMPAVGKSTVGVILAKMLGYDFADTDLLIQKQEGRRLEEIIRDKGVDGFLEIEEKVCCAIPAVSVSVRQDGSFDELVLPAVIATGGSAVYGKRAMEHFKEIGTVIYLDVSLRTLEKRLRNIRQRGVVLRDGQTLRDLYDERIALYRKYADITIPEDGKDIEETVQEILSLWNAHETSGSETDFGNPVPVECP